MKKTELFCEEIAKRKFPTFIWGAGEIAQLIHSKLATRKINTEGFVVDDQYVSNAGGGTIIRLCYKKS